MYFLHGSVLFLSIFAVKGRLIDRSHIDVSKIPDTDKLTVDFIINYGYPGEMHEVTTADNYTLKIHRIPHNGSNSDEERPVILLQHGIIVSSAFWVMRGDSDLAFLLSQQGYDVWISNARGTLYSWHKKYNINDLKFWDYSIDDLGKKDLSAIIDYVLEVTGKSHLTYVAHSRGVAMGVILLSTNPEYNTKINVFLGIGPVIYLKEAKSIIFQLFRNGPGTLMNSKILQEIFRTVGIGNLFYSANNYSQRILLQMCEPGSIFDNVIPYITFLVVGDDFETLNKTLVPLMVSHFKFGIATKELIHHLQVFESDIFKPYDYGKKENLRIYGSEEPEPYNFKNVTVPVYLYYGPNDFFVSERDYLKFVDQLPNFKESYKVPFKKFNHIDYMFATNANQLLYPKIISVINEYNKIE